MKAYQKFAAIVLVALLAFPAAASAQASVVVVDVQKLLTKSAAAQNIQGQVKTRREKLQSEFTTYEEELRSNEKSLVEQRSTLSPEAFAKKRQEFEKELVEKQRLVQGKKRALEEAVIKSTALLRGEIATIVAALSAQNNYDIVLTRQSVVIAAKSVDITDNVMTQLNDTVTQIKLEVASQ